MKNTHRTHSSKQGTQQAGAEDHHLPQPTGRIISLQLHISTATLISAFYHVIGPGFFRPRAPGGKGWVFITVVLYLDLVKVDTEKMIGWMDGWMDRRMNRQRDGKKEGAVL